MRRRVLSRIRNVRVVECDFGRRIAIVEGAAAVENLRCILGEHPVELRTEAGDGRVTEWVGAAVTVLIGNDEVEMPAVAIRAVADQAVDGREVVGLVAEAVLVPLLDGDIRHRGRIELLERGSAHLSASRRQILPPRLICGDLDALTWPGRTAGLLDALPALPREFVIVPHGDERPSRAGVLQIGIGQVAFVDGAIAFDRQRIVELAGLPAVGNAPDVVNRAVVTRFHFLGIFDDFVNEIAEVEDESELVLWRGALVLEDHPAIGVELAFIDVLAADEGEIDGARVAVERRGDRAADAAAVPVGVGEAVPVGPRGLEATDEYPRGPVGSGRDRRAGLRDDSPEGFIFGDFYGQQMLTVLERAPGPEDHTLRIWIARGHPFGIKIPAFTPPNARRARSTTPRERRAKRNRSPHEVAAA